MCATVNAIAHRWSKAATHGVPLCHKFLQPWTDTDGRVRHVEWPKNFAAHKIGVRRSRNAGDDFVQDLRRDLPLLGSRHYSVESSLHGDLEADPDRLAQVVRNLVTNAVSHTTADGHIDIAIASENGSAVFAVSDDGSGIEPDQLVRIFDRFHRTDEGRSRAEGGSGLGLAIARAIVEAHGGTIAAESPPGEGATFRFSIPGYRPD